jgi:hypothetical protein
MKSKRTAWAIFTVLILFAIGENTWVQRVLSASLLKEFPSNLTKPEIRCIDYAIRSSIESALVAFAHL